MDSKKWLFIFAALSGAGGLACIFQWLKIEPKDLWGWHLSLAIPHWLWFAFGLLLFIFSIGLSAYGIGIIRKSDKPDTIDDILEGLPKQAESKPQQVKPAWQKLQWCNEQREKLERSLQEGNKHLADVSRQRDQFQQEYATAASRVGHLEKELSAKLSIPLSALQRDALSLSYDLLNFLKQLGPPPTPKYTAEQIDNMSSARMKELINANDGDFFEACEYHRGGKLAFTESQLQSQLTARWMRLLPFYQKVAASYALNFKDKVEVMQHRFAIEGMADMVLLVPVQGAVAIENIHSIASKLWELAYVAGRK